MRSFIIFLLFLCFNLFGSSSYAHSATHFRLCLQSHKRVCTSAKPAENRKFSNDNCFKEDDSIFSTEEDDDEFRNEEHKSMVRDGLISFSSLCDFSHNNLAGRIALHWQVLQGNYLRYILLRSLRI